MDLEEENPGWSCPQLEARPILDDYCQKFWDAFLFLDSYRANVDTPISLLEVTAFFDLFSIDQEDQFEYLSLLKLLDREYIRLYRVEQKRKAPRI